MSKQTALQQLLSWFETPTMYGSSENPSVVVKIKSLMIEEKEQIQSAFESGMVKNNSSNRYVSDIEAENYYSQTFKND
jgi:hypothetical protein